MSEIKIPYINLKEQYVSIRSELIESISKTFDNCDFILGKELEDFEHRIAQMLGVKYVIGVNSGTDALILSMKALGIKEREEVITSPNSFIASTSSICMVGGIPKFVDIDDDENINPNFIRKAITPKTKAIMSVHLRGRPCKMDEIVEIANERNLIVIEDCSQAILARYNNKLVGTFGEVGCFSLHPIKILGAAGDAGIIITNNRETYDIIKLLRNHGLKNRDISILWGYNSRLDELQAAILNVKLKYITAWIEKRRKIAKIYLEELNDLQICLPYEKSNEYHVYTTFTVRTQLRDKLNEYLHKSCIETKIHYSIPIHLQPAARYLGYKDGDFPVAERQSKEILSLPIYPELSLEDVEYIIKSIKKFFSHCEV